MRSTWTPRCRSSRHGPTSRDKLTYGLLDAAVMLPPLALASNLGLRGPAARLIVPMGLSQGGNTIVLGGEAIKESAGLPPGARLLAWLAGLSGRPRIAVVHRFSTHNLLLRYWLALTGVDPDHDIETVVVPPEQVVPALAGGQIAGFCAGAPWGVTAEMAGAGSVLLGTSDIWPFHPEKCLAVREEWATANPETLTRLLRALMRAQVICDKPELADGRGRCAVRRRRPGFAAGGRARRVAGRVRPGADPFPRRGRGVPRSAARDVVPAADAPLGVAGAGNQHRRRSARDAVSAGSVLFGGPDGRFVRFPWPVAQFRGFRRLRGRPGAEGQRAAFLILPSNQCCCLQMSRNCLFNDHPSHGPSAHFLITSSAAAWHPSCCMCSQRCPNPDRAPTASLNDERDRTLGAVDPLPRQDRWINGDPSDQCEPHHA